jgi:hypothetical protein
VLLIPCILLLEQHYVFDLVAAVPLIVLAIGMVDGLKWRPGPSGTVDAPPEQN